MSMSKYASKADMERAKARRNQEPHKPAVVAMWVYSAEYAAQNGGSMDFWDGLSESKRDVCRALLERIKTAKDE